LLFGGNSGDETRLQSVEVFDTITRQFTTSPRAHDDQTATAGAAAAAVPDLQYPREELGGAILFL
jgi:hypothetical protein